MSMYVKLATMEFPRYEGDIRLEHPEIPQSATGDTFPCPPTYAKVTLTPVPAYNPSRYFIEEPKPVFVNGQWETQWTISPIPDEIGAARVREQRNKLLAECDWTQLADAPVDKAPWATYRQTLRDITAQTGFPWEVTWPTKPE